MSDTERTTDHKSDVGDSVALTGPIADGAPAERFPVPKLASEAAREAAEKPVEDLTTILSCGDFGGVARHEHTREVDGETITEDVFEPCDHPSSFGIPGSRYGITPGRCFHHTEAKLAEVQQRKATFLESYINEPELGIGAHAERLGLKSRATIYWWADHDPDFRENFKAIRIIADAIVTDMVEEKVIQRILDPKSGADTLRMWFLMNRRGQKWKNPNKVQGDFGIGGPSVSITGGQHVWQIGSQKVTF